MVHCPSSPLYRWRLSAGATFLAIGLGLAAGVAPHAATAQSTGTSAAEDGNAGRPANPASIATRRNPLRIDVPALPRQRNNISPILYSCSDMDDCQNQAAEFCETFNYPNGQILFRDLPSQPRPFPVYSVICFD